MSHIRRMLRAVCAYVIARALQLYHKMNTIKLYLYTRWVGMGWVGGVFVAARPPMSIFKYIVIYGHIWS